ncbi:hypothetical protein N7510_004029 [Penicillium lagena]|uniref:uncharacterized protein n=1 Tax=Penicillium lagena TaxID=94218 RepID=UPI00254213BC|nr:uncharacterized protein N7510_004029 [Penicillium lagena]KAJ5620045.1 hypothetical protein N7510_004029 [Penicillium lagena]
MSATSPAPDQPLLRDAAVIVDTSVSLTLGSDSLLVVGKNCAPVSVPYASLTMHTDERFARKPDRSCCGLCKSESETKHTIALLNVLDAELKSSNLVITYARPAGKNEVSVATLEYPVSQKESATMETWVRKLIDRAYGNAQRRKRLKVLVNPFGGKGTASYLFGTYAAPIFAAAKCEMDVQATTHRGHAIEIAEQLDLDAYDAVICCSGDGLPYEVFNGLGKRPNGREALARMPVALLPCGSGNGMTWNCFGTDSVSITAVEIVKGLRTPLDLVSITQKDSRTLSFLSQSFGIVADSDLGTDNIRWMGAQRFTFGFLIRLMQRTIYPCDLAMKVDMKDKTAIKEHYVSFKNRPDDPTSADSDRIEAAKQSPSLPELKYGTVMDKLPEDWEVIPGETMGNFYAGNMAIMTKDTNFFPAALPNDGFLDVVTIDGMVSRASSIKMMNEITTGGFFDMPDVKVRKVTAYRLIPHEKEGYISIDGEQLPFEAFQAEIHHGLGTMLSKSGRVYEAEGPRV